VRASGTIVLGHRESSIPFSYLSPRGEPIGYAVDLCKLVVEAIGEEVGRTLAIRWQPVTAESRIAAVASGQVDMECGSTTNNLERQKLVSFSPTFFVSGPSCW
jgi:glutamate/aspartate transport system substrate-binding protein